MPPKAHSRVAEFRRGNARYSPTARLAAGGMAEVWRGQAQFADGQSQAVAIKRVLPALASNTHYRRMLEDEARLGMLLRHPNIVRVFDAREVRGSYIIIMELVDGPSLRDLIPKLTERGLKLPVSVAVHIARQLAKALCYTHEAIDEWGRDLNIIHRDVSPHNVLVSKEGIAKLMDFGLANASSNLAERDPGMIGGKFGYLTPELVLQQRSSHLLDIFALGVVLWECLTGRRLFQGKDDGETVRKVARCEVPPASSINSEVPDELEQVLAGMLAKNPDERYQSARDLLGDLEYIASMMGGEPRHQLAELVQAAMERRVQARPSLPEGPFRTPQITRSPVTSTALRASNLAAEIIEELELLSLEDEDEPEHVTLQAPTQKKLV